MDDKKENIVYGKVEIDNYLQGKMSKEEMHLLERAALQDPFLADAIEGFSLVDAAVANNDLSAIETMILANREAAKVIEIDKKKNDWLKIAVAVILFAGAGWIGILLLNNSNKVNVGNNEKTIVSTEQNKLVLKDTAIKNHQPEIKVDEKNKQQQIVSLDKNANSTLTNHQSVKEVEPNTFYASNDVKKLDDASEKVASPIANGNIISSTQQNIVSNKASGPSASNNSNMFNANPDSRLTKEMEVQNNVESLKNKVATAKQLKAENVKNNSTIALPPIQVKRDSSIEAIPITGYFSKKGKVKQVDYKLTKEDSATIPVNGWAAFNDYLAKNNAYRSITYDTLYKPVTITNNKTGEEIVGLEFDIDEFGNPNKIKVTKSVDEQTDAKAIELLKRGPKWQTANKKTKGKLAIKF